MMWTLLHAPLWAKLFYLVLGGLCVLAVLFSDYIHKRDLGLYRRAVEMLDYWKDLYVHWRIKRKLKNKWRNQ